MKGEKTGGRVPGSVNKVTAETKQWIQNLIEGNHKKFERDLKKLDSYQRLQILEKMIQYIVPKMQTVDIQTQIQTEYSELEKLLLKAPDELIEKLTERILMIKQTEENK